MSKEVNPNLVIGAGVATVLAITAYKLFGPEKEVTVDMGVDGEDVAVQPTLTNQAARVIADAVFAAIYGDGTWMSGNAGEDEDAVIAALTGVQVVNDADVLLIVQQYGVRGGSFAFSGPLSLPAALVQYLNASERAEINNAYAVRGIQIQF